MEEQKHPDIIARCEKCQRGYVWLNRDNPDPRCLWKDCGGRVVLLPVPEPSPYDVPESQQLQ
jgi:hypothetical protein